MRWIRYTAASNTAYGILEGDAIREVVGDPFDGYTETPTTHALADVKIELPLIPKTFYAVGFNYPEHVREIAAKQGVEPNLPKQPDVGYRANNSLIAHDETIVVPKMATDQVQYEGELVVVIGRQAKHLSEADALSCVLGYTIGNDMSERTWQASDRTLWRAKNTDTFAPMGPWIETDLKLDKLETIVRRNGKEDIRFKTNAMLFGVERYISTISQVCTLYPGDVIWMGTDGSSPNLVDGDIIEVEITGIGTLRNPVQREA